MNVRIRIPRQLYDRVWNDLSRPHPFAAERVGFLYGRMGNIGTDAPIILFTSYSSLADERYVDDWRSGARIDSQAIREAMQGVLDSGEGVFHVHLHDFPGRPTFGGMDLDELPRLIPSFQAVGPDLAHGLFLLSLDGCAAEVWLPTCDRATSATRITVIGYPFQTVGGEP